jgi:hypothetical protein
VRLDRAGDAALHHLEEWFFYSTHGLPADRGGCVEGARQIPDAHTVTVDAGHACCTMQSEAFVPGLRIAVDSVVSRITGSRYATGRVPA